MDDKVSTGGVGGSGILNKLASDYGDKSTDESENSDDTVDSESSSESVVSQNETNHRDTPNSEQGYVTDEDVEFEAVVDKPQLPQTTEQLCISASANVDESAVSVMEESSETTSKNIDDENSLAQEALIDHGHNNNQTSHVVEELLELKDQVYRERRSSCSSSSGSSSASSSDDSVIQLSPDSSDSEDEQREQRSENQTSDKPKKPKEPKKSPRVKGELSLEDLDPIVDLQISVPEDKVQPIGQIKHIVGCIVTVESFENKPALDLSTVLFIDEGRKALGHVFEVFGRTSQPYYCVRFNSPEHVEERGVAPGMVVYAAPGTEHTRYVFLAQIERFRGTDASWKDDTETPSELIDYSDDEMERFVKNKKNKARPRKTQPCNRSFPPPPPNQDAQTVNRFARKRNFGYTEGSDANTTNGLAPDRFVPPVGPNFAPHPRVPHYRNQSPIRSPVFRPLGGGFRPPVCDGSYPNPDFYGAQRFRSVGPYGPPPPYGPPTPPYGPLPTQFNPYFCGNSMPYRQPYENDPYNQGWWNYTNQRPGLPTVPTQWYPPPQAYYDPQASWGRFHGQNDIPTFSAPCAPPPPPPPPSVPSVPQDSSAIAPTSVQR